MAAIKLATANGKRVANVYGPRPVEVCYTSGHFGHCKSIRNALVRATRHMVDAEGAQRANILIDGQIVADLDRSGSKIHVTWRAKWARESDLW